MRLRFVALVVALVVSGCTKGSQPGVGVDPVVAVVPVVAVAVWVDAGPPAGAAPLAQRPPGPPCIADLFPETPGSGLIRFQDRKTGRFGFRNKKGAIVIPARFGQAYEFNEHGVAAAIEEGTPAHLLFIDVKGHALAEAFAFDNGPDYFSDGRARIVAGGKVGFLERTGKMAVAPQYDFAEPFCRGQALVCMGCTKLVADEHTRWVGGRWGLIDSAGVWLIPLEDGQLEVAPDEVHFVRKSEGVQR
jgi:hypothetical protein